MGTVTPPTVTVTPQGDGDPPTGTVTPPTGTVTPHGDGDPSHGDADPPHRDGYPPRAAKAADGERDRPEPPLHFSL